MGEYLSATRSQVRLTFEVGLAQGALVPGKAILDSTSGNTGIGLAMVGAALGFPVKLVMPENVSVERKKVIRAFGAEIVGVHPGTWLDDDTIAFVRAVFDDRGLLLFRGVEVDRPHQFYLSELLRGLDPPTPEEAEAGAAAQDKFMISNKVPDAAAPIGRLLFHCDGMWSEEPFEVLSLYGVEVEPPVIPTLPSEDGSAATHSTAS